jgi:uncharacterized protein
MTTAAELFDLQETDLALDRAVERLAQIEEGLKEPEELVEGRAVVEEKAEAVKALKSRQKDQEWSVEEITTKAQDIEGRLYGGRVTNPKELADLDADLKSLKAEARRREDVLLGILVEMEEAEGELRQAQEEHDRVEGDWKASCSELLREKGEIDPEVERLRALREEQAAAVDRAAMGLYQLLRERRAGQAVARVERGMCQGCRITLPSSILQKARTGIGMVQCVSCERVLLVT